MVRLWRHLVRLVVDRDVVEDVLVPVGVFVPIHTGQTVFDDGAQFIGERRVEGLTGRNGGG